MQRRAFLETGLTGLAWTAMHGVGAANNTPTRFVIHVSGAAGGPVDEGCAAFAAELEKRGFSSILVHNSVRGSDTQNENRASAVIKALQSVKDHVVIIGISNEGNFVPLVAAARPIRRVVYVNAVIPHPGGAFIEVCQNSRLQFGKLAINSQGVPKHHRRSFETHSRSQRDACTTQSNAGTHRRIIIRSCHGRLLRSLSAENAADGRQRVRFGFGRRPDQTRVEAIDGASGPGRRSSCHRGRRPWGHRHKVSGSACGCLCQGPLT